MRSIKLALIFACSAGFLQAQNVKVSGNTKLNTDFSKYKTYAWANSDTTVPIDEYEIYSYSREVTLPAKPKSKKRAAAELSPRDPEHYIYSYDVIVPSTNPIVNSTIQNSVSEELEVRGYVQSANPDLLVAYRVFDRNAKLKGYVSDTPTMVGANEVHQPGDTTTFALTPGTLYITLVDAKTSEVVWDGFASGLYRQNAFVSDETKLKEAVHLILDEFKYRGDKIKVESAN